MCLPSSAKSVLAWLKRLAGRNALDVWHESHFEPSCPAWGSGEWQPAQLVGAPMYRGLSLWHLPQPARAWASRSANPVSAPWSNDFGGDHRMSG